MINETKYNLLYNRLYKLAWNNDYIDIQEDKYVQAISFAVEILNNYDISGNELTVKRILFYQKTNIKIIRGRKQYECENNFNHKINIGTYYAMINDGDNVYQSKRLCLSCSAKILIIIMTNFPPSDDYITYTNNHFDWELFEE